MSPGAGQLVYIGHSISKVSQVEGIVLKYGLPEITFSCDHLVKLKLSVIFGKHFCMGMNKISHHYLTSSIRNYPYSQFEYQEKPCTGFPIDTEIKACLLKDDFIRWEMLFAERSSRWWIRWKSRCGGLSSPYGTTNHLTRKGVNGSVSTGYNSPSTP